MLACLEDINRIEAMRLLITDSREKGFSLPEFAKQISELLKPQERADSRPAVAGPEQLPQVFAYALA